MMAKQAVFSGNPLQVKGRDELSPSQVKSTGSKLSGAVAELVSLKPKSAGSSASSFLQARSVSVIPKNIGIRNLIKKFGFLCVDILIKFMLVNMPTNIHQH